MPERSAASTAEREAAFEARQDEGAAEQDWAHARRTYVSGQAVRVS